MCKYCERLVGEVKELLVFDSAFPSRNKNGRESFEYGDALCIIGDAHLIVQQCGEEDICGKVKINYCPMCGRKVR